MHGAVPPSIFSRCLHDILLKCIFGQDKVSHTRMIVLPVVLSELWPFDCVFMFFGIINILVHAITHSEFSQDNVSGIIMNITPF